MAEGLFRHALDAQGDPLKSLKISSVGVSVFDRQPANPNAVAAMSKVGIDIKGHHSQPITEAVVANALAFFAMTETHLAMLAYQIDPPPANAFLMRQFIEGGADSQIPDPFGMNLSHYEACRDSMVEAVPSLLKTVEALYHAQLAANSGDK